MLVDTGLIMPRSRKCHRTLRTQWRFFLTPSSRTLQRGSGYTTLITHFGKSCLQPTPPEATPLYYATLCGFRSVVERLVVTCPQDVSARGGYYSTPLHATLAKHNLDIAQVLLEHHADVTASNRDELTPLHWASRRGYQDFVELLLKYHTDLNIQDGEEQTPLNVASRYGQAGVVRLLLQS